MASPTIRLALAGLLFCVLCFSSGCTLVLATAGAVVDTVIITSPLWGGSAVNTYKIDKVQEEARIGDLRDPFGAAVENLPSPEAGKTTILVRPFEGPVPSYREEVHYYSWWAMVPLMPYANRSAPILAAWDSATPVEFMGPPFDADTEYRFPLDRFPPGVRPAEGAALRKGLERGAALDLLAGEIAADEPTPADYAIAYYSNERRDLLFLLTEFTRARLADSLVPWPVRVQIPESAGRFRLSPAGSCIPCFDIPATPENECDDYRGGNIRFDVKDGDCVVQVPGSHRCVVARTLGYPKADASTVIITGKVKSFRVEVSNISYGVTTIGANLLSLFGLPLSSNRLVLELDVEARRGGDSEPFAVRSMELATQRRSVGMYYGGDFAGDLGRELEERLADELAQFADSLRAELAERSDVAALSAATLP